MEKILLKKSSGVVDEVLNVLREWYHELEGGRMSEIFKEISPADFFTGTGI